MDEPDALEYVDETLAGELSLLSSEAEGTLQGGERPNLQARIAMAHARAVYVAAESQARSSIRIEGATKRGDSYLDSGYGDDWARPGDACPRHPRPLRSGRLT
jgi:hypothetical protein